MTNPVTTGWLVYSIKNNEIEIYGLLQTEEKAKKDAKLASEALKREFRVVAVPFIGWGQVAPGIFSQNGPAPLRIIKDENT
jgi:hypothetical protein